MNTQLRYLLAGLSLATSALTPAWSAYPDKPVMLVVPYALGGMSTAFGNMVSESISPRLGHRLVVNYKPGATGALGAGFVAKTPADDYTLLMAENSTMSINPNLYAKLPFDPFMDFSPVSMMFTSSNVLVVNTNSQVRPVKDLIEYARSRHGSVFYGSAGNGATPHLYGEMFRQLSSVPVVHVPYRCSAPAISDLPKDQPDFMFADTSVLPQVAADHLGAAPDLSTMKEAGLKGFHIDTWYSLAALADTPHGVINRLHAEVARMLASPAVRERIHAIGVYQTTDISARYIGGIAHTATARWKEFVSGTRIRLD